MRTVPLKKTYDGHTVLDVPELELTPGRLCAVVGANGSGKTTLARILAGILPADDRVRPLPPGVRVGYMPQKSYAFRMTTLGNVRLTARDDDRALALMKELGIDHLSRERATLLSGGETARMALCRLLMVRRDLLILDEPTASMDMEATTLTEELLCRICREENCAVMLVTHSLQQARRIADEALFLHKGRLLESGEAKQVLYEPKAPETRQFLEFYGVL